MNYSYTQLEQLWDSNGGDPTMAPLMAAIALAESSGDPSSTNPTDNNGTQTSWGLWQISDGTHNQPVPNILDPNVNAQAAVSKLGSQGLGAWGTYTSGAYQQYLGPDATTATLTAANSRSGSTSANAATAGGGEFGAPYTPSAVPGVPATPPAFPDMSLNPVNDIARTLSWVGEFGAWAVFMLIILLFGIILLGLGTLVLIVLLASPVARPVAEVVGARSVVGRAVRRSQATAGANAASSRRMAEREHASGLRTQEREHAASSRRYGSGNTGRGGTPFHSEREIQRFRREGFETDRKPGS